MSKKSLNPLVLNLIGSSLLCVGGIIGYAKTGSIASLLAGVLFSALISITTIYTSQNGVTSNKGLRFLLCKLYIQLVENNFSDA